jgi:F-type H+-transporting ATPase subunit epsilon
MALTLEIVTPERRVISVSCDEVRAPGTEGGFGIRRGHTPFLTALDAGPLLYVEGGREHVFAVGGGFLQVAADKVLILADTAEPKDEIDVDRAKKALESARQKLRGLPQSDPAFDLETARVRRATARIAVAGR